MKKYLLTLLLILSFLMIPHPVSVVFATTSAQTPQQYIIKWHDETNWSSLGLMDTTIELLIQPDHLYRLTPESEEAKKILQAIHDNQPVQRTGETPYELTVDERRNIINTRQLKPYSQTAVTIQNTSIEEQIQGWQRNYFDFISFYDSMLEQTGSETITIAVIDTGLTILSEALHSRVLPGYNAIDNSSDVTDQNGHGTMVTSIIASNLDDYGFIGLTENIKIIPIKVSQSDGLLRQSDILKGLRYAIDQEVDVINMSYGGLVDNNFEAELLNEAYDKNITLVAASGNRGEGQLDYPARYEQVISVGSVEVPDNFSIASLQAHEQPLVRSAFSNYGKTLTLAAPGEEILSVFSSDELSIGSGTSFATSFVSSLAGLLYSEYTTVSPNIVERLITEGANYYQQRWTEEIGFGSINFYHTLSLDLPDLADDLPDVDEEKIKPFKPVKDTFQVPRDVDWLYFELDKPTEVLLEVTEPDDYTDMTIKLYDDTNPDLSAPVHVYSERNLQATLTEGRYYIELTETYNRWSNEPYTITLKQPFFTDVKVDQVHADGIHYLTTDGLLKGYPASDGTRYFDIDAPISRAHIAVIFSRVFDLPAPADTALILERYQDISPTHRYADEIAAAYTAGLLTGAPNDDSTYTFNDGPISREQLATVLVRAYQLTEQPEVIDMYLDNVDVSHKDSVYILGQYGLTNQLDDFRPQEAITRGQFATLLHRARIISQEMMDER